MTSEGLLPSSSKVEIRDGQLIVQGASILNYGKDKKRAILLLVEQNEWGHHKEKPKPILLYHRDRGHTIEDCQTLKDHLRQLEKAGYLGEFLVWEDSHQQDLKGASPSRTLVPAQGLIGVLHTASQQVEIAKTPPRVLTVGSVFDLELDGPMPKKWRWEVECILVPKKGRQEDECIAFTKKDLKDILQPHEDALVLTLQIGGFEVRRVMIDKGS